MNILFVNPPSTTSLHVAQPNTYIEDNVGIESFILARIPFQVMASIPNRDALTKDILLLDFEWYKNPSLTKEDLVDLVTKKSPILFLPH